MWYREELKHLIYLLLHNKSSYEDVVRLVHITSAIAKSYFKNYYHSFLLICTEHGLTENDLAEDSVLNIFMRNDEGDYVCLQRFMNSLDVDFENIDEHDLFRAYQGFVQTVAIRQLIKTYTQLDSTGARIYRNIRDYIREMDHIVLTRDFRGLVIKPSANTTADHLAAFPFKLLEQKFLRKAEKPYQTSRLLSVLMSIVTEQDVYRRSLPLFDVVTLFRRHYAHIADNDQSDNDKMDLSTLTRHDHQLMKTEIFYTIRQKILTTYVVSGKINFHDANLLYQTIVHIINDWFDNTSDRNPYYHHAKNILNSSENQYNKIWRTKIEYLVRIAREQLKMYLIEGL